jgi:hypothetical protein
MSDIPHPTILTSSFASTCSITSTSRCFIFICGSIADGGVFMSWQLKQMVIQHDQNAR